MVVDVRDAKDGCFPSSESFCYISVFSIDCLHSSLHPLFDSLRACYITFPTTVTYSRHPVWLILARVAGMSPLEIRYLATNEDNLVTDLRLQHFCNDYLVSCTSHYSEGKHQ